MPARAYQLFKYSVYLLLAINIFFWLQIDWAASDHTFAAGVSWREFVEAFSATVDTAAWVILLLLFELETYVLLEKTLSKPASWTMHGVRALCYLFIVYSAYGYFAKADLLHNVQAIAPGTHLCDLVDGQTSFMTDLDEYELLDGSNCQEFETGANYVRIGALDIVTDNATLKSGSILAWVDVVNAITWILVVLLLELDVRLQARVMYAGRALHFSTAGKVLLYSILLAAAIYWGIASTFLDFWDAFLWLVAFVFIEMNVKPAQVLRRVAPSKG